MAAGPSGGPGDRDAATTASRRGGRQARRTLDITVISWDNMVEARLMNPATLVLDELSGYKTKGSARWRNANRLTKRPGVKQVWGLTGTPAPNGLLDVWAQVHLLDDGARLGRNFEAYRSRYFEPGTYVNKRGKRVPAVTWVGGREVVTSWEPKPGAVEAIYALIEDVCLSMRAEGRIKLPPRTDVTHTIELPRAARSAYEEIKETLVADLGLIGEGVYTAANAAVLTSKLSQIAAGFLYPDLDAPEDPTARLHDLKTELVVAIAEGTGSPLLAFYRFREERAALARALPQARGIEERDVIDAWNAGDVPVLLAHPASAGHGLNLQHGGHTQAWVTRPWELDLWEQGVGAKGRPTQSSYTASRQPTP
jgi:hypothetical protein